MPTLYPIWPNHVYCGPAALACLTGCDAKGPVRQWINEVRERPHNRGVTGLPGYVLEAVLTRRGYAFEYTSYPTRPRPRRLAEFVDSLPTDTFYIINVTNHYVSALNGMVADNWYRFGSPVEEHPHRRKWVKAAWRIIGSN